MEISQQVATAGKLGVRVISPFDKITIYITLGFLLVLVVNSCVQSVQQKSVYPLFDGVLFRIVGADHNIGRDIDELAKMEKFEGEMFSFEWFKNVWSKISFWGNVVINVWFIALIIYWFKKVFDFINNTNPILNWAFGISLFLLLQLVIGLFLYPVNHSGQTLMEDKISLLNDVAKESYPFQGTVKLIKHVITRDLFSRIAESPLEKFASLPESNINLTGH